MAKTPESLTHQKAEVLRHSQTLQTSKDEVTGQALSKLLTIHLEQCRSQLETAVGESIPRLQGEVRAYRRMLSYQEPAAFTLSPQ